MQNEILYTPKKRFYLERRDGVNFVVIAIFSATFEIGISDTQSFLPNEANENASKALACGCEQSSKIPLIPLMRAFT